MTTSEYKLSAPVADWLVRRELVPYAEVSGRMPYHGAERVRRVDAIGRDWRRLVAVELKCTVGRQAIEQAVACQSFATEAWIASFSCSDQFAALCAEHGVGVLLVREPEEVGDSLVTEVLPCVIQVPSPESFAEWQGNLARSSPNGEAGRPNMAGVSRESDTLAALVAFFRENPRSGWRAAWRAVPNDCAKFTVLKAKHAKRVKEAL